jgi:quaternary ammonium compound-resistance protein SugE
MKNLWIIGALVVMGAIGLILGLNGKDIADAGDFSLGYFSAGNFSAGIFSAGIFSAGIFSIGVFSIGVFSLGIFNIGVVALGFFLIAWKKKYARVHVVPEPETSDAK